MAKKKIAVGKKQKRFMTYQEFMELEARVTALEKKVIGVQK